MSPACPVLRLPGTVRRGNAAPEWTGVGPAASLIAEREAGEGAMSWWKAVAALVVLGGCAELDPIPDWPGTGFSSQEPLEGPALPAAYQRQVERALTEPPFANGALAVLATEGGELHSWTLVPCRGGVAVCGGSAQGPAGRVVRTPDYLAVEGLYGRRFWLSHGGDGYVERQGRFVPLAWDARPNGTGPGIEPVLETPFPHL